MEHCPSCIVELKKDRKKLGHFTVWLVCPKCGLRKREDDPSTEMLNYFKRKDEIKKQILDKQIEDETNN